MAPGARDPGPRRGRRRKGAGSPAQRHQGLRPGAGATTMAKVDLWHARLALKTLTRERRQAIAEVAEG